MTDSLLRCDDCGRHLNHDDQYCSQCGQPTPINTSAHATVVDEAGAVEAGSAAAPISDRRSDNTVVSGAATTAPPSKVSFGRRFRDVLGDEFEVLSLLGQGGFARVYKARDRRLDRIVAIKVIQPELAGNEPFMDSFRSEGVALAKLRHPGIVPIYDIRERGGLIYHIMPFVEGATLDERLNRSRLPPYESRRILSELADALSAAHKAKVVHLDIKPENVFLEGELQQALLLDFGIAAAIADLVPETGGPIAGTPSYMSPEQARGLPDLDHRSDIYSLGALGYRMIMGRPPYVAGTIEEVLAKHETESPVHIRDINPTIPQDFADAIMKCLAKDPWKRFATVKEFATVLEGVTFTTQRDTQSYEVSAKSGRTIEILIGILVFLIGIMVGQAIG